MCVLGGTPILPFSTILKIDFGIVPTVWYILFFILFTKNAKFQLCTLSLSQTKNNTHMHVWIQTKYYLFKCTNKSISTKMYFWTHVLHNISKQKHTLKQNLMGCYFI